MTYYYADNNWPKIGTELDLGIPMSSAFESPASYLPSQGLVAAVNTALMLGQPLLVTGEPGTGKTQLAYHVARRLGLLRPIRFEVKSSTESRDLFYTIDSLRQFRDYSLKTKDEKLDPLDYIDFQALGLAILRAANQELTKPLQEKITHRNEIDLWDDDQTSLDMPHRSVVLIDEIDKAPRDVPNDLLNEIENTYFRLPELYDRLKVIERFSARDDLRPIVIFTSNSEKNLPDAFMRRCVYYNIEFPNREELKEIIQERMRTLEIGQSLVDDVLNLVMEHLRKGARALDNKPGTAEVLAFLMALHRQGVGQSRNLNACYEQAANAAGTLAKNAKDLDKVLNQIKTLYAPK